MRKPQPACFVRTYVCESSPAPFPGFGWQGSTHHIAREDLTEVIVVRLAGRRPEDTIFDLLHRALGAEPGARKKMLIQPFPRAQLDILHRSGQADIRSFDLSSIGPLPAGCLHV